MLFLGEKQGHRRCIGSSCRRRPWGAVSPASGGRTRAAGCGRRGRVRGLGLAATAWAQGGPLSPVGPRWSGRHSAGALSSLALTRCTDFFALGHGVQRGGCEVLLVARRRELAGEGERACARAANLVFGECDMTNLSEIQTRESAFCRNIQAYPLPQVSNTSGFFTLP